MKSMIFLVCAAALAVVVAIFGRSILGGNGNQVYLALAAVAVLAAAVKWQGVVRRRERQKLDQMRDSALW